MLDTYDMPNWLMFINRTSQEWIDKQTAEMTKTLSRIGPVKTVIDIGASVGYMAAVYAMAGARVWAFEPNPESYRMLCENLRINNMMSTVYPSNLAIGPRGSKNVTLYSLNDSLEQTGMFYPSGKYLGEFPCTTLSKVLEMVPGEIDLLKIDMEGMEHFTVPELTPEELRRVRFIDMEDHFRDQSPGLDKFLIERGFTKETEKFWRRNEIC